MTDLKMAIQRYQEALDTTPADHPDRASRLESLGIGYRDRYQRTGAMTDLEIAIQRYQEALDHSSSPIKKLPE
jgi:tetratricopeptide (TPR) repeat protein